MLNAPEKIMKSLLKFSVSLNIKLNEKNVILQVNKAGTSSLRDFSASLETTFPNSRKTFQDKLWNLVAIIFVGYLR